MRDFKKLMTYTSIILRDMLSSDWLSMSASDARVLSLEALEIVKERLKCQIRTLKISCAHNALQLRWELVNLTVKSINRISSTSSASIAVSRQSGSAGEILTFVNLVITLLETTKFLLVIPLNAS